LVMNISKKILKTDYPNAFWDDRKNTLDLS
jgi:hypothetical protein